MKKQKTFVHIIPPSKRMMNTYIKMIREQFPENEHTFMFFDECTKNDSELFNYGNIEYLSNSNNWLKKYKAMYDMYKKYDYVIWHGFIYGGMYMLFLFIFQYFIKKTVWVMRGIDLYNWRHLNGGIREKIVNMINYHIRNSVPNVVAIFPTDIEIYKSQFKGNSNIYCIPYPMSKDSFEDMERISKRKQRLNGETWIQICNNSYAFNNHLEILDYISKFKDENLKLFIPLSYGNDFKNIIENYPKKVEEEYIKEFSEDKVNILRRLIPIEEYTRLICNMNIAIFGANRQNALGNILRQLYIGNKIFLSNKNPLYDFFKKIGIDISCIEDIPKMNFKQFTNETNKLHSQRWLQMNFHPDYNYKAWQKMFEAININKEKNICDYYTYITKFKDESNNGDKINNYDINNIHEYRSNFIQIYKYSSTNKNMLRNYNNLKNIYIVGDEEYSQLILQGIFKENQRDFKYIPMGILSNDKLTIKNIQKPIDVVGRIEDYLETKLENDCIITAIMNPEERRQVVEKIVEEGKDRNSMEIGFVSLDTTCNCGYNSEIGVGCYVSSNSVVGINCTIGDHTYIFDSNIGKNCSIGNYVTLKSGAIICDNVVIEDKVIIGEGSIIYSNIKISNGTVIVPGSIVRESI